MIRATRDNTHVGSRIGFPPHGAGERATVLKVLAFPGEETVVARVRFDDGVETDVMLEPAGDEECYYLLEETQH